MSKDVRITRTLACRISDRWTVYRLLRLPSWGRVPDPWMAVPPGKATGKRCATQAEALAYARERATRHLTIVPVVQEVCS